MADVQQIEAAVKETAKLLGVSPLEIADAALALTAHAREVRKHLSSGGTATKQPAKKSAAKQEKPPSYEQLKHVLAETGRQLSVASLAVPQRITALLGRNGAGWLAGISCPILPVDSDVLGPRFERRLMRSRIHSRMMRM